MNKQLIKEILKEIKAELAAPTCQSYEYDATPTERERMENIGVLVRGLEEELFNESEKVEESFHTFSDGGMTVRIPNKI